MHVSDKPKYWDKVNEKFFSKYYGIDKCHKTWEAIAWQNKRIVGPLGREWEVYPEHGEKGIKLSITKLTNFPVQGTAADVMMIARISLARRLRALNIPAKLITTVHDSIVIDTPAEYAQQVANLMHQVFDDLIPNIKRLFGYDWVVPLECETKVGMDMKNMSEVKRTDK